MVANSSADERRLRAQRGKEFLISQILEEAEREDVTLSEIERKMLQFTETQESLPDIYDVNDQFEREYDTAKYEKKVAGLVRNAYRRGCKESGETKGRWKKAIADLRKEDHYLLVMVNQGLEPSAVVGYGIGIGIAVAFFLLIVLWTALDARGLIPAWLSKLLSDHSALVFFSVAFGIVLIWTAIRLGRSGIFRKATRE